MSDENSTVTSEVFLGHANNIFALNDSVACYVSVTLASVEGRGDELRIRGRLDPMPEPLKQVEIDEHIKVAISAMSVVPTSFDLDDGIDPAFARRLIYVWDEWNDNAHRPGCEHQTRLGWRQDDEGFFHEKAGTPCPFCGHPFRTEPQYEPLPYDVVDFIETVVFKLVPPDEVKVTTLEGDAIPLSQYRKRILQKADAKLMDIKRSMIRGEDYVEIQQGQVITHRLTMTGLRKLAEAGDVDATARLDRIERFGWKKGDVEVVEEGERKA